VATPTDANGPAGEEKPTTADDGFVRSPLQQRSEIGALGHTSCSRKGSERLSSGLEPIDGSNSRLRRHPLGGYDHNLTAILEDQLPHIVQNVVHLGIRQVVELYPARPSVDAAEDMAIGFDEKRSYPPCDLPLPEEWMCECSFQRRRITRCW
jgi:hypothetical protein